MLIFLSFFPSFGFSVAVSGAKGFLWFAFGDRMKDALSNIRSILENHHVAIVNMMNSFMKTIGDASHSQPAVLLNQPVTFGPFPPAFQLPFLPPPALPPSLAQAEQFLNQLLGELEPERVLSDPVMASFFSFVLFPL